MGKEKLEKDNPIAPFNPRKFVCSKWPYLRLGQGMRFDAGHLTVTTPEQMARLEKSEEFQHKQIIELKDRKTPKLSVQESAELAALAELKKLEPKARSGAISTANLLG